MPSDLTGTVTSSHDPKPPELPPLPEAILLRASPGFQSWEVATVDDKEVNEDGDGFVIPLADYRQIQAELKALATQENAKETRPTADKRTPEEREADSLDRQMDWQQ